MTFNDKSPNIVLIIKGVAGSTLLVGRVASGHARPDDSWQARTMPSLHFRSVNTRYNAQMSTHDDVMLSGTFSGDVEAQSEVVEERVCPIGGRHDM